MTLEGAINLNETNDYIIYTMNSVTTGQYGVVVPKNVSGTLNMLVDLHMKSSFDSIGIGTKTKEQLVSEISDEYSKLKAKYADGMLVMPMIDEAVFQSTVLNGDKQKMFDEVKKIGAITSELYKKLTESGIDKQKIDQKIIVVEKNGEDEKFVAWLKEQMPNFVDGILYSELSPVQSVVNPFVDSNDIFGPATSQAVVSEEETAVTSTPVSGGGIFDNVAPVAPVAPAVASSVSVGSVPAVGEVPVVNSVNVPEPSVSADLFGTPANSQSSVGVGAPVENVSVQSFGSTASPAPVQQSVVEGPRPVESAMLDGTIAFTPIPNHPNNPVEVAPATEEETTETNKGSKGFANLVILLVVLVGVTLISIELGKYLYSVYGA